MRLTIAQAVGLVADTAWAQRPRPLGFVPKIDPRLRACYCPRLHSPPPAPYFGGVQRIQLSLPLPVFGSGGAGAAGLVGCAESEPRDCPPRRYGQNGLTATGRRRLTAGCCLLEERRSLLSFWTITLPDDVLWELCQLDGWSTFQNAIRQRLTRRLADLGAVPLVLAVAELHPERSAAAGQALPHLHVLFQGKLRAGEDWLLTPAQLDGLILSALRAAGLHREELAAAGQVERIRKSVRRYLSKYVSKASRQLAASGHGLMVGDPRLCPRQWWFMSRPLLELIEEATRALPADFLAWCCDRSREAWQGAPFVVQRVAIADPAAPSVWCVSFRSPWALFKTWEAYERAVILGERDPHCFRSHDRSLSELHPELD